MDLLFYFCFSDDYHWYNLTAIDVKTGKAVMNLDTLDLLQGSQYAFLSGFACT